MKYGSKQAICLEVKPTNRKKIEEFYFKTTRELEKFFEFKIGDRKILLIDSRKDLNKIMREKTPRWNTGLYSHDVIFILKPEKIETESNHKKEDFWSTLKHEMTHMYYSALTKTSKPRWLNEGLAVYLAKQRRISKPMDAISVIKKFDSFEGGDYSLSGKIVELLLKRFGKIKFLKLVKRIPMNLTKKKFNLLFKKIYGFDLNKKNLMEKLN